MHSVSRSLSLLRPTLRAREAIAPRLSFPIHCRAYSLSPPQSPFGKAHRLTQPSSGPYIRSLSPSSPSSSPRNIQPDDFLYYPDALNQEDQAVLIKLALWKLDRVDTKKKRRRRRSGDSGAGTIATGGQTNLQALFEEESAYGFEEVRPSFH